MKRERNGYSTLLIDEVQKKLRYEVNDYRIRTETPELWRTMAHKDDNTFKLIKYPCNMPEN